MLRKKKNIKRYIGYVSLLLIPGLLTGSVFADAWAVTDNAGEKTVRVGLQDLPCSVTFHVPDQSDYKCLDYTTTTVNNITNGTLLSNVSGVPDTSSFNEFSFQGWFTDDELTESFGASSAITQSLDLYAKYSRNNVLVSNSSTNAEYTNFYLSSSNAQNIWANHVYKIDTQVWGTAPTRTSGNRVELTSGTGSYKAVYSNSSWTFKRVLKVSIEWNSSWWTEDGAVTRLWCFGASNGSPADSWTDPISFTNNVATVDVDAAYTGFIVVRFNPSYINNNWWDYVWNQTVDISLTTDSKGTNNGSYQYNSTVIKIWTNDGNKGYEWGS